MTTLLDSSPVEGETSQSMHSYIVTPVFSDFSNQADVVGTLGMLVSWVRYFEAVVPPEVKGVTVVVGDSCGLTYSVLVDGDQVEVLGKGDLHDTNYNEYRESATLGGATGDTGASFYVQANCVYTLDIYPTKELEDAYLSKLPVIYAIAVAVIFVFTAFVFLVYDWAVQLRQNKVLKTATRTQAIVSSLFPKNVQERIFRDVEDEVKNETKQPVGLFRGNRTKDQLKTFLDDGAGRGQISEGPANLKSKPIADLFPEATIIFAEYVLRDKRNFCFSLVGIENIWLTIHLITLCFQSIVGFTAWSSTREPTQVFTLLENIYHSFDEIAKRRRIFKVETVGDCYVAGTSTHWIISCLSF